MTSAILATSGAMVMAIALQLILGVTAKVWAEWTGKTAPIEVMKQLTKDDIKPMYKARYWDVVQGDHLPSGVDISVADFGVNAGPSRGETIAAGGDGNTGWHDRVKNLNAPVVSYPALTFFLKKVRYFFRDNTKITSLYRTKY